LGYRFILSFVVFFFCFFGLTGCGQPDDYDHIFFLTTMDTAVELHFNFSDRERAAQIKEEVSNEMERLEKLLSRSAAESEIAKINRLAGLEPVPVRPETLAVIQQALNYSVISGGAFDPTIGPLINSWGFLGQQYSLPSETEIEKALALVDYRKVIIDLTLPAVYLPAEGMNLELGGIAKGFIVDRAVDVLKNNNVTEAFINAGGDIALLGNNRNNKWRIGIRHPRKADEIIAILDLENGAVATSGDYQRCFELNGLNYHHLIDPSTGRPARDLISVTVIADQVSEADALATSVFILGLEKGILLIENLDGVEGILITPELDVISSSGLNGLLELQ
jgi:FAD:protein FMN transferase